MFLLQLLVIIIGIRRLIAANDSIRKIQDNEWPLDIHDFSSNRKLWGICEDGSQPIIHYFEVDVQIQPSTDVTGICTLADQMKLGSDINAILSSYAIGDSGIDQSTSFKAAVCTVPVESSRRALQLKTYVWRGGGGCHGCFCDCHDGRRDLLNSVWGTTEWFDNVYAPQLEGAIRNSILTMVIPNHPKCLGRSPTVTVNVMKVSLTELIARFQCQQGRIISLLNTMTLNSVAVIDRMCNRCVTIDFSKTSSGAPVFGGMKVSNQWQSDGLTIEAIGIAPYNSRTNTITAASPPTEGRILDTGSDTCLKRVDSLEFGSPNRSCPGGGIGLGSGGQVGSEGENCKAIGNVLIFQDPEFFDEICSKASDNGGMLSFIFEKPVFVHDFGVLDMDDANGSILMLTYSDNVFEFFNFVRFGDNAVQRVIVAKPNVKRLDFLFAQKSGAVTEISYCRRCTASTGHDDNRECVVAGNIIDKTTEIIEEDNFEAKEIDDALSGWVNGNINSDEMTKFSKFLGLCNQDSIPPYKVFSVPVAAEAIIVELDFYEIDAWSLEDSATVFLDGEKITMRFEGNKDEGDKQGTTQLGVSWKSVSLTSPQHLGFSSKYMDQKHHITIEVPATSKLYSDGQLRLTLSCGAKRSGNAFAGWDNVKVTARYGCSFFNDNETRNPTLKPTSKPTLIPTRLPTQFPPSVANGPILTKIPTVRSTKQPTKATTPQPTRSSIKEQTEIPTKQPTRKPTKAQ